MKKYEESGNISASCDCISIGRRTFYEWQKNDADFAESFEDLCESVGDFVEDQLLMQVKAGETAATIFYCKTKLKKRGYVERIENEQVGDQKVIIHETIITSDEYNKRRLSAGNIFDESEESSS